MFNYQVACSYETNHIHLIDIINCSNIIYVSLICFNDIFCHRYKDIFQDVDGLQALVNETCEIYEDLSLMYPPVFCHLDPHIYNFIWNPKAGTY